MSPSVEAPVLPVSSPAVVGWSGCRGRHLLLPLLCLFTWSAGLGELLTLGEVKDPAVSPRATPCWQVEQFMVTGECRKCTLFELKTLLACIRTTFVMKINCPESQREEYKSCRSSSMEETLFWRFEAAMISLGLVFAAVVTFRQRALDRLASEKVRKQIESI